MFTVPYDISLGEISSGRNVIQLVFLEIFTHSELCVIRADTTNIRYKVLLPILLRFLTQDERVYYYPPTSSFLVYLVENPNVFSDSDFTQCNFKMYPFHI